MTTIRNFVVTLVGTLLAAGVTHAAWTDIAVIEPKYVKVLPTDKVKVGATVVIECGWSAVNKINIHTEWAATKKLAKLNWEVPGEITLDGVSIWKFAVPVNQLGASAQVSTIWIAKKPGLHSGECSIDPNNIANVQSKKTIAFNVEVLPTVMSPGVGDVVATQPIPPNEKKIPPNTGPVMETAPMAPPDITSAATLTIGGVGGAWGSTINVNASQAFSKNLNNNGLCEFLIEHTARNIGLAPTGAFSSIWKNTAVPGSWSRAWPPLAAGASKAEKDLVSLKPGHNLLNLTLDHLQQVQESNEGNNQFRVIVNLGGNCGSPGGIVPPPAGAGQPGAGSTTRLPAVQQPGTPQRPGAQRN